MNDSLSIILPVHNAERALAGQVARLLEILPDLTSRFEIVVVDDASSDHTVELARELAVQFPQVRLIRHRDRRGEQAAVRTGLQWASGGTMFVQEDAGALRTSDLLRLWSLRRERDLVLAGSGARPRVFDDVLLKRLTETGQQQPAAAHAAKSASGIHMIRREAALRLLADETADDEPLAAPQITQCRSDDAHAAIKPRRGNAFLRHLKNLALGE